MYRYESAFEGTFESTFESTSVQYMYVVPPVRVRVQGTEVRKYYRTVQCCNFERRSYLKLSSPKVSVALYFRKCAEPSKIHVLPYMRIRRYGSAEVRKHESTSKGTSVVDSTVHCVRVHYTVHVVYSIFIHTTFY